MTAYEEQRLDFLDQIFDGQLQGLARHVFLEPFELPNGEFAQEAYLFFVTDLEAKEMPVIHEHELHFTFRNNDSPCKFRARWGLWADGVTDIFEASEVSGGKSGDDNCQRGFRFVSNDSPLTRSVGSWGAESLEDLLDYLLTHFTIPDTTAILDAEQIDFKAFLYERKYFLENYK